MNPRFVWTSLSALFLLESYGSGALNSLTFPCTKDGTICGRPYFDAIMDRVVGGLEAQAGAWPWMVALVELGHPMCGGSVIHERVVLTAAHCFLNESIDPTRWQVLAGKHNLQLVEPDQEIRKVSKIILHGGFNRSTMENDIALLVLDEELSFSSYIQPLCIPAVEHRAAVGKRCLLAGWGTTRGTGDHNVLNQVFLPIISDEVCSLPDWYSSAFIPGFTFCAGYEAGGRDSCQGDSGGPLICSEASKWFIQGISSWGRQCAEYKWPGVYTNVSMYIDWITSTMVTNVCGVVVG